MTLYDALCLCLDGLAQARRLLLQGGMVVSEDALRRFFSKIERTDDGCWRWRGHVYKGKGYGSFSEEKGECWSSGRSRKIYFAHRWLWEAIHGKVPPGLQLDHLCKNKWCVNPMHLEPVTPRENVLRSNSVPALNARKTHCKRGHPLSGANLYLHRGRCGMQRSCRICRDTSTRAYQARNPDIVRERARGYQRQRRQNARA